MVIDFSLIAQHSKFNHHILLFWADNSSNKILVYHCQITDQFLHEIMRNNFEIIKMIKFVLWLIIWIKWKKNIKEVELGCKYSLWGAKSRSLLISMSNLYINCSFIRNLFGIRILIQTSCILWISKNLWVPPLLNYNPYCQMGSWLW